MTSSTSKASAFEASKPQASTPNFVLSLLAACSSSVPAAGKEGEAAISDQLSSLVKDKAVTVDELNLVYSYRFGFSIKDALKFAGFEGTLQDFIDQQKCFSMHDGLVSLIAAATPAMQDPPSDIASAAVLDDYIKGSDDEQEPSSELAFAAVLGDYIKDADDETASNAETGSTTDAESYHLDSDSDVDVSGWHSVGNRLVAALGSQSCYEADVDVDAMPWMMLGGRVAAALSAKDEGDEYDVAAWHDVGSRLVTACKQSNDGECFQDPSPDVDEWRSVGARVLRSLTPELEGGLDDL